MSKGVSLVYSVSINQTALFVTSSSASISLKFTSFRDCISCLWNYPAILKVNDAQ